MQRRYCHIRCFYRFWRWIVTMAILLMLNSLLLSLGLSWSFDHSNNQVAPREVVVAIATDDIHRSVYAKEAITGRRMLLAKTTKVKTPQAKTTKSPRKTNPPTKVPLVKGRVLKPLNGSRIFYTAIPGCGERALAEVIEHLSTKLGFKVVSKNNLQALANVSEASTISEFTKHKPPVFYNSLQRFVDFEKYGYKSPTYISIIREPFDRFLYMYHQTKYNIKRGPNYQKRLFMTLDECLEEHHPDCMQLLESVGEVAFFCGHAKLCRTPSNAALLKAKQSIDRYYTAVGITDVITEFFLLMEHKLPKFFHGAVEYFSENEDVFEDNFRTTERIVPGHSSYKILTKYLKYDLDLYKWVRGRFDHQFKRIKNVMV